MWGKVTRRARALEIMDDILVSSRIRGWIKQEVNRGKYYIRSPKGMELAHARGREAAKGFGHQYSQFNDIMLHRLQHKHDNYGRSNKIRIPTAEEESK